MVTKTDQSRQSFRIAISGYYGFRNSGDEAVLKSILLALELSAKEQGIVITPVVLSIDPEWTARMYGVEAVHRMRPQSVLAALRGCDGLISGGGSLLQDATSAKTIPYYTGVIKLAQWLGKPTFIYSQGIGPLHRGWMNPLIRSAMRHSRYVSVRDPESAELLARIGVARDRIEVVPDPVMGLPLPVAGKKEASKDERPIVGVSLRYWRKDRADMDAVASGLSQLASERDVRLRFLPFHTPDDIEASQYVLERLGELTGSSAEIIDAGDDPQQMLLQVSRCDLLIGMRLHALIYAANTKVPLLGISYDPKIDQFLHRLQQSAIGTTERLEPSALAAAAGELLENRAGWLADNNDIIDKLKQQSRQPAQHIVHFLRQLIKR
ncbi:polysaccharide pyruvyl transferase CsaB [Paenibacillus sp. SYP-B4298]|uniref:polysaccharide pyruvyl transferase CsaB n=1 Tax=Paenibacillus sp. SYP-B4298 TaxID=2996034 RepID=UPI0022DD782E|nr:polysaccharide pyruvyl transferase CsaB [Paenibacillus sp. SYP-B4298]